MKRLDFFLAAMRAGMYRHKNWVISAFAITQENPDAYKGDPYPYRIIQTPTGVFFVNPENPEELESLDDLVPGQPPFNKAEKVSIKVGDIENVYNLINGVTEAGIETSYGNILANCILLVYPFGRKIPFLLGKIKPEQLEDMILPRLVDDPVEGELAPVTRTSDIARSIYVSEYLKFTNAMTYISGFANLWVTGGTEKCLLPPPGLKEFKESLFKKYGIDPSDQNFDPEVIAKIAAELKGLDAQWLAGDDALNFLIGSKVDVTRGKKFLMVGAEAGLGDGQNMELVPNSLAEGWDVDKMPAMINNLRAGSFNRGAETMKGGESVKWLQRASSNINILPGDCGTKLGKNITLTPELRKKYLNFSALVPGAGTTTVRLTEDVIDQYIGKQLAIRSPMYCIHKHTDYCATCVGPRLEENPTGSSSAISDFGSTIMLMFMKANHGKALLLKKYDYKLRIL
jgi:hypothetical protein